MTIDMANMGIDTLSALVGGFFAFLIIMHLRTTWMLRREADRNAHSEFKSHVNALMKKLDKMGTPSSSSSPQGARNRPVKRRQAKAVPASRTKRLSFPTRSSWRK